MKLTKWLDVNFSVDYRIGKEVRFSCPVCGHDNFYFNLHKKVGHCHRATCGYNPSLAILIERVGNSPDEDSFAPFQDIDPPAPDREISLPESLPIVEYNSEGIMVTYNYKVLSLLAEKRKIQYTDMIKWGIRTDGKYIYVPVKENGKLVSYISRIIWGLENQGKRYVYPNGVNPLKYFHGWADYRSVNF